MVRWAMVIQELNLDIYHRSGKSNYVADALSRNSVEVANVIAFQSVESSPNSLTPESNIGKLQRCNKEFLPKTQALVYRSEVVVKPVLVMIALKFVFFLPYLLFAYCVAIQYSTQASPFYLLYGREPGPQQKQP